MPSLARVMDAQPLTLQQLLGVLRRRRFTILAIVAIAAGAAVALSLRSPKEYRAGASLLVGPSQSLPFLNLGSSSTALTAPTAAHLVRTQQVAQRVKRVLGTRVSTSHLLSQIST